EGIHYVWLRASDDETSSHDRTVEKALEKINRARQSGAARGRGPGAADNEPDRPAADPAEPRPAAGRRPRPDVTIDFDRLNERVKTIAARVNRRPNSPESVLFWSADGKKLLFPATVGGQSGTFAVDFPDDLQPKLVTPATGVQARWLRSANQIVWLS